MINATDKRLAFNRAAQAPRARLPHGRAAACAALLLAAVEAAIVAGMALPGLWFEGLPPGWGGLAVALTAGLAFVLLVHTLSAYGFAQLRRPERVLPPLLGLGVLAVAVAIMIGGELAGPGVPPLSERLLAIGLVTLLLGASRVLASRAIARAEARGRLRFQVAVLDVMPLGTGFDREHLRRQLEAEHHCRCDIELVRPDYAMAGWRETAVEAVRWADAVVVAGLPEIGRGRLAVLLEALEVVPVRVELAVPYGTDGENFAMSRVHEAPLGLTARVLKRGMDIVLSTLLLAFVGPLMLLVALAVKLDSKGPVFFRQVRRGYNNRSFEALKFRSLRHEMADPLANRLVTKGDPRVTRVGAFLRRSSIDELPQLLNVLKGDMSLVGPRPHPLNAKAGGRPYEAVVERFQRRYRVRPGLTGWAQVSGLRGNTETAADLERRVACDLDYIRRWSFWLDLAILLRTPIAAIKGENAC